MPEGLGILPPPAPDTVKFNVPAFSEVNASVSLPYLGGSGVDGSLYDQGDLVTPIASDTGSGFADLTAINNTASTRTFYVEYYSGSASTGTYWPYAVNLGNDQDGDAWYTKGGGLGWDCDDGDAAIFQGAAGEVPADGIDTNCNGDDDS